MVIVIIAIIIALLWIDALWRIALAAILWAPVLFCAVAAMHWISSLHLNDPLVPLYAFLAAGAAARAGMVLALRALYSRFAKL